MTKRLLWVIAASMGLLVLAPTAAQAKGSPELVITTEDGTRVIRLDGIRGMVWGPPHEPPNIDGQVGYPAESYLVGIYGSTGKPFRQHEGTWTVFPVAGAMHSESGQWLAFSYATADAVRAALREPPDRPRRAEPDRTAIAFLAAGLGMAAFAFLRIRRARRLSRASEAATA